MTGAAHSVGGIGKESEKAGTQTDKLGKQSKTASGKIRGAAGSLAKFAGGAAALYAAKRAMTSSIKETENLAKGTMKLSRTTGMDEKAASEWAAITQVRGINADALNKGLVKLSQGMSKAANGGAKSRENFRKLGISIKDVRAGDTQKVLFQMADGMKKIQNPAKKAALAQAMLGKQGQALAPLLMGGSDGIKEQMQLADEMGATMSGKGVEGVKDMAKNQRDMKLAMLGLKVTIGTALLPVIKAITALFAKWIQKLNPILRNGPLMKVIIGGLAAAFIGLKIALIATTLAASPLLLIPIAIAAIGAALVYAYMKVKWFRNAVNAVFSFIKKHWQLVLIMLTGGTGVAIVLIIKHFKSIKKAAIVVFNALRAAFVWALPGLKKMWKAVKTIAAAWWDANVKVGKFIGKVLGIAGRVLGAVGKVSAAFIKIGVAIVRGIIAGIKKAGPAIAHTIEKLPGVKIVGGLAGLASKIVPNARGGITSAGQISLVGERGPELAQYPGGTRIIPLPAPSMPSLAGALAGATGRGQTTAHFYLDRRLIATAVAQDTADQKARR
jgi:hypothetical protein